jgi:predicted RND superfamily exporter protein
MLPNIFPAILIFGTMGLVGMLCDIGSMMTAGAALGMAVDGTIHFLTWYRRSQEEGNSRHQAIRDAYGECANAMIQSSVICGLGILVFAWSGFVPTSRFAWLMSAMIGTALVGDLVLLPALLASSLGRLFDPKVKKAPADSPLTVAADAALVTS